MASPTSYTDPFHRLPDGTWSHLHGGHNSENKCIYCYKTSPETEFCETRTASEEASERLRAKKRDLAASAIAKLTKEEVEAISWVLRGTL